MEDSNRNEQFSYSGRTALVVIDLQNGIVNQPHAPYTGAQVVQNAVRLINAFTKRGGFVALFRVSYLDGRDMLKPETDYDVYPAQLPKGWDSYVPELQNLKNVYYITKRQWGGFYGTDLDLQLRRRNIGTIVLCGISTAIGVDTTAREAYQRGYNQIFVEDAMTAGTREEHDYEVKYVFPRIGRIRSTEEAVSIMR